jgi:hypothetical protein
MAVAAAPARSGTAVVRTVTVPIGERGRGEVAGSFGASSTTPARGVRISPNKFARTYV